ncbi:hypothetical protein M8C21_007889 [Ambrosia artemisiifolia]|uniref:Uncharacterized protein n=1 Tax=Ambrosia artemisiifolia TaxID=4212 RepID=A0AAD5BPC0_AMBAR|nr:hypothetical protein M8C21_007889 [Ambrosia artemisiifolia]
MELLFLVLTSLLFFFILRSINHNRNRNQRLPPGPTGLPIIGNLFDLGPKPHESLAKLSKKHGPLMTIRLGSTTTVVASTPEAAREILQHNDEACSGRVVPDAVSSLPDNDVAMAWIPANDEFRTMRKALSICLTNQHKLDTFRDLRQKVVEGMLDFLNESGRKKANVDIGKLAFAVALNMMSNTCLSRNILIYGRRMCPGIPVAQRVVSLMVASFVYHCDWKLPHAREEMNMEDIFGLTLFRATPLLASPIPVAPCA